MSIPAGYSRVQSRENAFRWLKANHLVAAQTVEVRIGYGPQTLYYWPNELISKAPKPSEERKAAARKAVTTKCKNLVAWVKSVEIQIDVPADLTQLAKLAIRHRNDYRRYHRSGNYREDFERADYYAGAETDEDVIRWMKNYLRHMASCYEHTLSSMRGKTGVDEVYSLLRKRIDRRIDAIIETMRLS